MQYLMLIYDGAAPSFCYYNSYGKSEKMDIATLRQAILFARKEGLQLNVITSCEALPQDAVSELDGIVHVVIAPGGFPHDYVRNVIVVEWSESLDCGLLSDNPDRNLILRMPREALDKLAHTVWLLRSKGHRINVQLLDQNRYSEEDLHQYALQLEKLSQLVLDTGMEINLLTDRLVLDKMNSCGAGDTAITVAPDGKLYVCPGFWYDGGESCGDVWKGLDIPNRQLYKLEYAPICRRCDAYQCRRCVWLNAKSTGEVNTPSRGQCVVAHKERHASVLLSLKTSKPLEDVPYDDPFEIIN